MINDGRVTPKKYEDMDQAERDLRDFARKMYLALWTIRGMPFPEQDNMLSANMRIVAINTLEQGDINTLSFGDAPGQGEK